MPSNPASSAAPKFASSSAAERPSSVAKLRRSNSVPSVPSSASSASTETPVAPSRARNNSAKSSLARSSAASRNAAEIASATRASKRSYECSSAGAGAGAGVLETSVSSPCCCAASRLAATSSTIRPNRDVAGSRLRSADVSAALATRLRAAPSSPASTARRRFSRSAFARNPRGVEVMLAAGAGAGAEAWSVASPEVWSAVVPPMAETEASAGAGAGAAAAAAARQPPHRSLRCAALRRRRDASASSAASASSVASAERFPGVRCCRASAKMPSNKPSAPFARTARAASFARFVAFDEARSDSRSSEASVDGDLFSAAPASAPAASRTTQSAAATRSARMGVGVSERGRGVRNAVRASRGVTRVPRTQPFFAVCLLASGNTKKKISSWLLAFFPARGDGVARTPAGIVPRWVASPATERPDPPSPLRDSRAVCLARVRR